MLKHGHDCVLMFWGLDCFGKSLWGTSLGVRERCLVLNGGCVEACAGVSIFLVFLVKKAVNFV